MPQRPRNSLYSSHLVRAAATAQIIARGVGIPICFDQRLRERQLGIFEGLTKQDVQHQHASIYAKYTQRDPGFRIPGGESMREHFELTVECIQDIRSKHEGGRVLVVAHGGSLNAIFRKTTGIDLEARRTFSLLNASINVFHMDDHRWKLVCWGDVSHLEGGALGDTSSMSNEA